MTEEEKWKKLALKYRLVLKDISLYIYNSATSSYFKEVEYNRAIKPLKDRATEALYYNPEIDDD